MLISFYVANTFAVEAQATDGHVTFVEEFAITHFSIYNASNARVSFKFAANGGLDKFELTVFPRGASDDNCDGYMCARIKLLASKQGHIELSAMFSLVTRDMNLMWTIPGPIITYGNLEETSKLFRLKSVVNVSKLALDNDTLTIRMDGSYVIKILYNVVTSSSKYEAHVHKYVNMTYTWNVCNLTLPLVAANAIISARFPAGYDLAQFYLIVQPGTKVKEYVSVFWIMMLKSASEAIKLPFRFNYTLALLDSAPGHMIISKTNSISQFVEKISDIREAPSFLKYSNLLNATQNQWKCATFQFHTDYAA